MIVGPFSVSRKLVVSAIVRCLQSLIDVFQCLFSGRLANFKVALGAIIISLITHFPAYNEFNNMLSHSLINQALNIKVQNPLSPIPPSLKEMESHNDKIELRLTVPILGRLSGTGMWTVVIWSHLSGFGVFYLLAVLAKRALDDEVGGALFVLGLAPTFFGAWFFNDTAFGDGVSFFFSLLAIASGSVLVSFGSFLAAAFCDERAVAAMPLLLVYLVLSHSGDTEKGLRRRLCVSILLGAGAWWLLRIWIASAFHLTMGTSDLATRAIFLDQMAESFPRVLFSIFKASWTLPLFAISTLVLQRRWRPSLAIAGAFAVAIAPAFMVADFNRSVCYTFVILLISLHFLWGDRDASRKYLAGILIVNLLLISPGTTIFRIPFKAIAGFVKR
jgi:hypothetical protein